MDELTITEAATRLSVHRPTVWQGVQDGALCPRHVGPTYIPTYIMKMKAADMERLVGQPPRMGPGCPHGRPRKRPSMPEWPS